MARTLLTLSAAAYEAALAATDPGDAVTFARAETNFGTSLVLLATESGEYNRENCFTARDLFAGQPGVKVRYWCELGNFRP